MCLLVLSRTKIRLFVAMNHSTNVLRRSCAENPENGGFYNFTVVTVRGEKELRFSGSLYIFDSTKVRRVYPGISAFYTCNKYFFIEYEYFLEALSSRLFQHPKHHHADQQQTQSRKCLFGPFQKGIQRKSGGDEHKNQRNDGAPIAINLRPR